MKGRDDLEIQRRVGKIEGLIQELEEGPESPAREAARELATALLDFHGAGLGRILEKLAAAGAPGRAIAEACMGDDLVASLLALHDLPRMETGLVQLRTGRDAPAPRVPVAPPELSFEPLRVSAVPFAAVPMLSLEVVVKAGRAEETVHALMLRCQVRIEPQQRSYSAVEEEMLRDLFGDPRTFDRSQRPFLWTHAVATVPRFVGETVTEITLPCTYDLAVASARYFDALQDGEVPLLLLFSGTAFIAREDGSLEAKPIPWSREARFRLPVGVWREAMDQQYPNSAPLLVRRDVFERLRRVRAERRLTSWDEALAALLDEAGGR